MSFLGHVIFSGGISVDPSKVDTVLEWETPKSITKNRSFLGLASYYRRFIEGFFEINFAFESSDSEMSNLWDVQSEESFQELKRKLTSEPILILSSPNESFVVYCDSSKMDLGGVLMRNG